MHVCSIVGARPQFVKAAVVSRALADAGIEETLVHTGQHYDAEMSSIFFHELDLAEPSVNLEVGSGSHAVQTGEIMIRLERVLQAEDSWDWVLVYGDTNSTIAAAMVASKLHIPLAHVEAGLRSFNRKMPEEINRIVTDRLSSLLFCPTQTAVEHLRDEGIEEGVHLTGDVMLDATRTFYDRASARMDLEQIIGEEEYYLATVHRAENTDDPAKLASIFEGFRRVDAPIVLPLHPRTRSRMDSIAVPPNVTIREPVGYLEMLLLVAHARGVFTDSGGLQKEALWLETPCVTLREETEWVESLTNGWNRLAGSDPDRIVEAAGRPPEGPSASLGDPGSTTASHRIAELLFTETSGT